MVALFHIIAIFAATAVLCSANTATAEDGILPDKIVFGQTAALEGPAAKLGVGMRDGILAAFKEKNDAGGIDGKKLELVSINDGYEPEQSIRNTRELIETHKVFSLIGGVGTPTSKAIEPLTTMEKVPYIAPFTGAEYLRTPFKRYVLNIRGSYFEETEKMTAYLADRMGMKKIAILYQDDSFGRAGLEGMVRALKKRDLSLAVEATFKRNTTAVKHAVLNLRKGSPEAIVMIGPYEPIASFISLYKKTVSKETVFITLSFVGTEALAGSLGADGKDILVTEVVPDPFDLSLPIVAAYQKAIKNYDQNLEYGYVSLEGYISARFVISALENMDGEVTREEFLDYVYQKKNFNLDGLEMNFGENDNQGMSTIYMTRFTGEGSFIPFLY